VNSKQFKDAMRYLWMPRLVERIQAAATATATAGSPTASASATTTITTNNNTTYNYSNNNLNNSFEVHSGNMMLSPAIVNNFGGSQSYTPENSSTGASSDSFGTQVSPVSELTQDYYNNVTVGNSNSNSNNNNNPDPDYYQQVQDQLSFLDCITSPSGLFSQQLDFQSLEPNTPWIQSNGDTSNGFWNVENMFLFQQLTDNM